MAASTPAKDVERRKFSFLQDTALTFPELWLSVYVVGNPYEQRQFAELFVRGQCRKADDVSEADLVIFTGGADVNPKLYSTPAHRLSRFDDKRDADDLALYYQCIEAGVPMVGICRGAQFLHVMNGGVLYQDVDQHHGDHAMWDPVNSRLVNKVSSVHHQMCKDNPEGGMMVLGVINAKSTTRHLSPTITETGVNPDIEAFFYRETCCLGVQGHPEYRGYFEFQQWFLKAIEDRIVHCGDLSYAEKGAPLRVKADILAARIERWKKELN